MHMRNVYIFLIQTFTSHREGDSPLATSYITSPATNSPEPCKVGQAVSCCGLSSTGMQMGGSCTTRLDSTALLLVQNTTAPSLGRRAVVRGPLIVSKTPQPSQPSKWFMVALVEAKKRNTTLWQDSNKLASPIPLDIHEHEAYGMFPTAGSGRENS